MKPENEVGRNIKLKFAGFYLASVLLMILIGITFWKNNPQPIQQATLKSVPGTKNSVEHQVVLSDELLHNRLSQLQELDKKYALLLTDSTLSSFQLDSANKIILNAEALFRKTIDSVEQENKQYNSVDNENMLTNMTDAFSISLENRRSANNIRMALVTSRKGMNTDQKSLLQLQNELQKKDDRIAELEASLKTKPVVASINTSDNNDLIKRNESLRTDIKTMEDKNYALTKLVNSLKQDNENLTGQLNDQHTTKRTIESSEGDTKTKTAAMERRLEELNAELSFARVECNLSRADAKQIISNSRQRKDLLTDALNTLNSLARSDNAAIQQKAKEKINQLNRLATTLRD